MSGIASGAQVNVLEGVQVDGTDLTITNKKVNVDLSGKTDVPESVTVDTSFTFRKTGDGLNIDAKNALIKGIKGRTDAWNQEMKPGVFGTQSAAGVTITDNNDGTFTVNGTATGNAQISPVTNLNLIAGHKYAYATRKLSGAAAPAFGIVGTTASSQNGWTIRTSSGSGALSDAYFYISSGASYDNVRVRVPLIDLTLAYGSGKEPSTVDAFLKDYPYALGTSYNAGKLLGNSVTGMETTGKNQFDERWAAGDISSSTGANTTSSTAMRSVNYISVIPSATYYFYITDSVVFKMRYYDGNKNYLGYVDANGAQNATKGVTRVMPPNCHYIRVAIDRLTVPKSCINLSDASVNGTYEPYNRTRRELPITTSTGKLNGTGASQVVFPNGMNGVGTSFDEIAVENGLAKKGIRRRARVDLGTLTWTYDANSGLMFAQLANIADPGNPRRVPLACAKYTGIYDGRTLADTPNKSIFNRTAPNLGVMVKDSAYSDATAFKASMSGVMLDYQLATPQTFIFDTPFPVIYPVHANGTEEATPIGLDANGVPESTPFVGTIFYKEAFEDIYVQDLIVDKIAVCTGTKNEFLKADGSLDDVTETGAQKNIIETIKVNNTALTPTNKTVNITVPTKTSDLTNDDNVVKDANYIHTDNNYTSAEKTKLSNALTTPTTVSKTDQSFAYRAVENGVVPTGAASIAKIKGRTDGWNQGVRNAQFDAVGNWNSTNATFSVSGGKGTFTASAQNGGIYQNNVLPKVARRKVFVAVTLKTTAAVNEIDVYMYGGYAILRNVAASGYQTISGYITTNASWGADLNNNHIIIRDRRTAGWDAVEVASIVAIDLTLMYGAGREPATPAAFLAEYPEALTAPYNAGKLVSNKVTAVVTDGFNQWDEVTEVGSLDATGNNVALTDRLRSKNYMPVFPNTAYHFKTPNALGVYWYDINKNFIFSISAVNSNLTAPGNAYYLRFYIIPAYGTTYKNDIAINLSHSGIRDGEYEPYWESERALNIPTMMGKKIVNGSTEGQESVNIFADMVGDTPVVGMKGIDSVYDFGQVEVDGYIRKVTKKIAAFGVTSDLSLDSIVTTSLASSNVVFIGLPLAGKIRGRNLSNKYKEDTTATQSSTQADKTIRLTENSACCIRDTSILTSGMTKEQVRTALLGVTFIYELETPEEYLLDTPIHSNYRVDDFGTEQRLPSGIVDGAPASTPLVADIVYNSTIIKDVNVSGILDYAKRTEVAKVESKKADKVLIDTTEPAGGMIPNTLYNFGTLSGNTTFTMATPVDNTVLNH